MASASPTCLPCNALYEPNPDIAGQAIFLAFLAHTCTFIFLAMIVTPIISFYLPPVPTRIASGPDVIPMQVEELQIQEASGFRRPERDITVASGPNVIPMQVEELQIQEASGFRRPERDITVEELQIQEASGFRRPERDITVEELQIQEASGFRLPERDTTPRYLYRCYCQQTIESTYTSQYISGVAFIVTAFVKWREISPYHLRVIYSIVSMHTIIGLVANYGRQSLLSLSFARLCLGADRAPSWDRLVYKALDSAVLLNLLLLSIFTVLVPVYSYRDQCFQSCYDKNTWTYAVSVVFFYYLLIFSIQQNGDNGPLGWTIFTSFITLFIVFQVWQFRELTRIFRPVALPLGISSELTFSFGQILVLFMIFPLVTEFLGALYVDLKRILQHVGQDAPARTLFINLFKILLPWFFNRLVTAIHTGLDGLLTTILKGASKIKAAVSFSRTRFPRRSNTSRLESGSADSRQSSNVELQNQSSVADDGNEIQPTTSTSTLGASRRSTYPLPQDDEIRPESVLPPSAVAQAQLRH